jgi:hypothetical protein
VPDCEVFEAYVEHILTPAIRFGQVVMMDNLTAYNHGSYGRESES